MGSYQEETKKEEMTPANTTTVRKSSKLSFSIERILSIPYLKETNPKNTNSYVKHLGFNNPVSTRRRFNVDSTSGDVESTLNRRHVLTGNERNKNHGKQNLNVECFTTQSFKCDEMNHTGHHTMQPQFDWLQCTRYKPPKVIRAKRKKSITPRSNRQPRIPFSPYQQTALEKQYRVHQYLTSQLLHELSIILKLSKQRIKIWYQNRRARDRREKLSKESDLQ